MTPCANDITEGMAGIMQKFFKLEDYRISPSVRGVEGTETDDTLLFECKPSNGLSRIPPFCSTFPIDEGLDERYNLDEIFEDDAIEIVVGGGGGVGE
ncbi:hypothetical protein ACFX2I_027904 [Malus domestica]